jgi:DNA gyrase subunit A
VLLLTSRGRGWRGNVGYVLEQGGARELGLERDERLISIAVLRPEAYVIMGTRLGRVKRTAVSDLSMPERTWETLMGLGEEDELLFGAVAGAGTHLLFYTVGGQLLRLDGDEINPQQTGTATGVVGIKIKPGDRLLGGTVVAHAAQTEGKSQVIVFSTAGYAHRVPLAEFPVQGRGAMGVRCLRPSRSGGDVGGVAVWQEGTIDVYLSDGRRQRFDLKDIPEGARDALGKKLLDAGKATVERVVVLI